MIDRVTVRGWLFLFAALSGSAALACGPSFPWQLLDNRDQTLEDLPVDSFASGATHLMPKPALHLPQPIAKDGADPPTTESEERRTLSASNAALVSIMRRQPDAGAAEAAGRALPDGVRLYVAGAVAFTHGDCAGAADRFRQVLALRASSGPDRTLWAGFMLGRALAACGDDAAAAAAFQRVRARVDGGVADPLALALASFGEEALLSLRASGLPMDNGASARDDPGALAVARLHQAVTLYAGQAALGGDNGTNSLQLVAEALLSDKPEAATWVAVAVRDRLLCRLLVLYALSATGPAPQSMFEANGRDVLLYDAPFFSNLAPERFADRVLDRLSAVMTAGEALDGLDAGRLAALAYLEGRYDLAGRFAAKGTGPLAAWIRAKLSLQRNDLRAVGLAYDAAVRELATHPDALTTEAAGRVRAEAGIITLARGDFQQAMTILYPLADAYWGDVAYLAERVLTTDELRRFVTASVPQVRPMAERNASPWDAARALRELLARRLMRNGRWAEATATFTMTEERRQAAAYADALLRSRRAFWRTDRARAAWDAALVARQHGLELFGTELDPDQDAVDGQYDHAYGPSRPPSGTLVSVNERWRYAGSAAEPDRRFHYRFLAVQDAERAADALPARSQAFAAVLCRAAGWMFQSDDEAEAFRLYKRYTASGAVVPFATHFGYGCPPPDFAMAARLRWREPVSQAVFVLHRHRRPAVEAAVVLAVLMGAAALIRRRRHRA